MSHELIFLELQAIVEARNKMKQEEEEVLVVKVPKWMQRPRPWDEWDARKQVAYIKFQTDIRMRYKVRQRKIEIEKNHLEKTQLKSYKSWYGRILLL
jgi:hypothetical protein